MTSTVVVLEDNFKAVKDSITGSILIEAAKAGGFVIEGAAKINVSDQPGGLKVRTDALRSGITTEELKKSQTYAEVGIGPVVIYARIHEYGGVIKTRYATIHIPARPYMRPAVDENEDRIRAGVETEMRRSLDQAAP